MADPKPPLAPLAMRTLNQVLGLAESPRGRMIPNDVRHVITTLAGLVAELAVRVDAMPSPTIPTTEGPR